jgi:putative cell wall-binding protein
VPMAYVATGTNFPDALAAAARAGHEDAPVLLTRTGALPPAAVEALGALRPRAVTVMGETDVLSDQVVTQLRTLTGATVTRVAGADRYATAAALTQRFPAAVTKVYVATGSNFPDALATAARAGHEGAPLVLVGKNAVPATTAAALKRLAPTSIEVIGSTAVLSDDVRWGVEKYLR